MIQSLCVCHIRMLFKGSQQNALNRNFQLSQLLLSLLNHKPLHQIIEDLQLSDSAFFEMQQSSNPVIRCTNSKTTNIN